MRKIPFVYYRRFRHRRRAGGVARQDSEGREHLRFERAIEIVDFCAHRQAVRNRVDHGCDVAHVCFEYALLVSKHVHVHGLSHLHQPRVGFANVREQPYARRISNREHRSPAAGL